MQWNMDHSRHNIEDVAAGYDALPKYDPKAVHAWKQLADESKEHADYIRQHLNVTETDNPEPYDNSEDMIRDIRNNRNFIVSTANSEHPIWTPEQNVDFRIVHDVFGHAATEGDFGWHGENNACSTHFALSSPHSQKALATECLGQTGYAIHRGNFTDQKVGFIPGLHEGLAAANKDTPIPTQAQLMQRALYGPPKQSKWKTAESQDANRMYRQHTDGTPVAETTFESIQNKDTSEPYEDEYIIINGKKWKKIRRKNNPQPDTYKDPIGGWGFYSKLIDEIERQPWVIVSNEIAKPIDVNNIDQYTIPTSYKVVEKMIPHFARYGVIPIARKENNAARGYSLNELPEGGGFESKVDYTYDHDIHLYDPETQQIVYGMEYSLNHPDAFEFHSTDGMGSPIYDNPDDEYDAFHEHHYPTYVNSIHYNAPARHQGADDPRFYDGSRIYLNELNEEGKPSNTFGDYNQVVDKFNKRYPRLSLSVLRWMHDNLPKPIGANIVNPKLKQKAKKQDYYHEAKWKKVSIPPAEEAKEYAKGYEKSEEPSSEYLEERYKWNPEVRGHRWKLNYNNLERVFNHPDFPVKGKYNVFTVDPKSAPTEDTSMKHWKRTPLGTHEAASPNRAGSIHINPLISAESANEALWHELQHAYQDQEGRFTPEMRENYFDPTDISGLSDEEVDRKFKENYLEHPMEKDANKFADFMRQYPLIEQSEPVYKSRWVNFSVANKEVDEETKSIINKYYQEHGSQRRLPLPSIESKWKKISAGLWDPERTEPSRYYGTKVVEEIPLNIAMQMLDIERGKEDYERENIENLVENVSQNGLLEPVIIEFNINDNTAYIGEGNHRVQVAKKMGMEWIPARCVRNESRKSRFKELPVRWQGTQTDHRGNLYIPPHFPPHMIGLPVKEKVKGFEDNHFYNGWDTKESKWIKKEAPARSKAQYRYMQGICNGSIEPPEGMTRTQACEYVEGQSSKGLPEKKSHWVKGYHAAVLDPNSSKIYIANSPAGFHTTALTDNGYQEGWPEDAWRGLYNPETKELVHMSSPYEAENPAFWEILHKDKMIEHSPRDYRETWLRAAENQSLPVSSLRVMTHEGDNAYNLPNMPDSPGPESNYKFYTVYDEDKGPQAQNAFLSKIAKQQEMEKTLTKMGFSEKAAVVIALDYISKQSYWINGYHAAVALRDPETKVWHMDVGFNDKLTHGGVTADYISDLGTKTMREMVADKDSRTDYYNNHTARGLYHPITKDFIHMSHPDFWDETEYNFKDLNQDSRNKMEEFWRQLAEQNNIELGEVRVLNNQTGHVEDLSVSDLEMPEEVERARRMYERNRPLSPWEREHGGYDTKTGNVKTAHWIQGFHAAIINQHGKMEVAPPTMKIVDSEGNVTEEDDTPWYATHWDLQGYPQYRGLYNHKTGELIHMTSLEEHENLINKEYLDKSKALNPLEHETSWRKAAEESNIPINNFKLLYKKSEDESEDEPPNKIWSNPLNTKEDFDLTDPEEFMPKQSKWRKRGHWLKDYHAAIITPKGEMKIAREWDDFHGSLFIDTERNYHRGLYNKKTGQLLHMTTPEEWNKLKDSWGGHDEDYDKRWPMGFEWFNSPEHFISPYKTEKEWIKAAEENGVPVSEVKFFSGESEFSPFTGFDVNNFNTHSPQEVAAKYGKWKVSKKDAWETVLDGKLGHDIITTGTWEEVKKQTIKWLKQLKNGYINKKNPHDNEKIDADAKEQDSHALEDLKLYEEQKRWSFRFDHGKHPYDLIIQPVGYKESSNNWRHGDCDLFAIKKHQETGWPIYKVAEKPNDPAWHFFLIDPKTGMGLDGDGFREVEEILYEHDPDFNPEYEELGIYPEIFKSSLEEAKNYRKGYKQSKWKRKSHWIKDFHAAVIDPEGTMHIAQDWNDVHDQVLRQNGWPGGTLPNSYRGLYNPETKELFHMTSPDERGFTIGEYATEPSQFKDLNDHENVWREAAKQSGISVEDFKGLYKPHDSNENSWRTNLPWSQENPKETFRYVSPKQSKWRKKSLDMIFPKYKVGDRLLFEYHCYEGEDSCDAELWRHTHQPVTIIQAPTLTPNVNSLTKHPSANDPMAYLGTEWGSLLYRVRFDDGLEYDVNEDELMKSEKGYYRPDYKKSKWKKKSHWVEGYHAAVINGDGKMLVADSPYQAHVQAFPDEERGRALMNRNYWRGLYNPDTESVLHMSTPDEYKEMQAGMVELAPLHGGILTEQHDYYDNNWKAAAKRSNIPISDVKLVSWNTSEPYPAWDNSRYKNDAKQFHISDLKTSKWKTSDKKKRKIHPKFQTSLKDHQKSVRKHGPLKTHKVRNFKKKSVLNEDQGKALFEYEPYMYHDVAAARTKGELKDQIDTVKSILNNGILPKEQTGISEYDDWLTSRPNHVYIGREGFYPRTVPPAIRINMSKIDPSTLKPDEDIYHAFGFSDKHKDQIDIHGLKSAPFEEEHRNNPNYTLGQWMEDHSHLDTPKNVLASFALNNSLAVQGGVPADALEISPKWVDHIKERHGIDITKML